MCRGNFTISANSTDVSARVGFTVSEQLITPETDASLTDNAQGSSNFAAKGAHRLKIDLTLFLKKMRVQLMTQILLS